MGWGNVHGNEAFYRVQSRASDLLKLELHSVENKPTLVLGNKL